MGLYQGPLLVAGNWKMHGTRESCRALAEDIAREVGSLEEVDVAIFPPYPSLPDAAEALRGTRIALGGQDLDAREKGAFTGAVSGSMLRSFGCRHVLVGHSERRSHFGDTDETVREKVGRAIVSDLDPILCVGESAEERDAERGEAVVSRQIRIALDGFDTADTTRLTVAYEPVWAIGTGRAATPEMAAAMQAMIRTDLIERFGEERAAGIRILYGGSANPQNAGELLARPEVDGLLVGGASLDATSFSAMAKAAVAA